jgi:hypothetical protein
MAAHGRHRTMPFAPLAAALWLAVAAAPSAAGGHLWELSLDVRAGDGATMDARVSIQSIADGHYYPAGMDTSLLAHDRYCYPRPGQAIQVPAGLLQVTASRGPEWAPKTVSVYMDGDRQLTITLQRLVDLRPRGQYAGDMHAHSVHVPSDFTVTMPQALRVARAEDLAVLHSLDEAVGFTGAPDAVSDDSTLVYRTYEYRNQTFGHTAWPGLRTAIGEGCCLYPEEPWPPLGALRAQVGGAGGALMILAHPHTTDAYSQQDQWPGAGLGRELPVLAALGEIDGLDVASYSNAPDTSWSDWHDALSSGCRLTPTAGTDAVLGRFVDGPPGGWRVYADLGDGAPLDYDAWLDAVRAGRTVVTSLPLVPAFHVAGAGPGDALEWPGDTLDAPVTLELACSSGITGARLVCERGTIWSVSLSGRDPLPLAWDTTFTLHAATPGWLALRVTGQAGGTSMLGLPAVAHTNAIRLLAAGQPRRDRAAAGRLLDEVDELEQLLASRTWTATWHRDSVLGRLDRARTALGVAFTDAPGAFHLTTDVGHGPVEELDWTRAADPEPGDRVRYRVTCAQDSLFTTPCVLWTDNSVLPEGNVPPGCGTWWRIEALDRGGHATACDPPVFTATLAGPSAVPPDRGPTLVRAWPNPSRGTVRLEGLAADAVILDIAGRRVAGPGLATEGRWLTWDGRSRGHRVPAGVYRAISRSTGARVSFVIVE